MSSKENNQEQSSSENLLYQRLILFLIVFSILVLGAVNTQRKILFLSILALGVIISWVLTLIIIRTAKSVDKKSGGKLIRLLLGYLVPIFCSLLLTMTLVVGSFGFVDPYLFNVDVKPVQLENKVDEIKNAIKNQLKPKETTTKNFKSIDSVINNDSLTRAREKNLLRSGTNKKNDSKYFKSIDKVVR
ncbi:MAG: hypothetical protein FIA82_04485 [Melioribacter sp.]|nr:hypothetical protein [Melioribacter sp.]